MFIWHALVIDLHLEMYILIHIMCVLVVIHVHVLRLYFNVTSSKIMCIHFYFSLFDLKTFIWFIHDMRLLSA